MAFFADEASAAASAKRGVPEELGRDGRRDRAEGCKECEVVRFIGVTSQGRLSGNIVHS
jgi:hypothetical protein